MVKRRGIIKEGLGLHLLKMLKLVMIIVLYPRDWFILGVDTRKGFPLYGFSLGLVI
jgi:hypothetical protein